jgi:GH25 family lysozyme M1 (1,4-beta-N-acetylmuramidase)
MFPDISEFQGAVDWNALDNAYHIGQIEAVSMRAGFGTVRADAQFARNQSECRARGIPAIYYWFNYPDTNSPQAEASMFNSVVGPLQANEAMMGDFEDDRTHIFPRGQAGVDWAKAFLTALEAPQNASWWYTYPFLLGVIPFEQLYGIWPFVIADYSATPDSAFSQAIARQFTNCGSTPGIAGCCDQNRVLQEPLSRWLTLGGTSVTQSEKLAWARMAYNAFLWRVPSTQEQSDWANQILDDGSNVDAVMAAIEDSVEGQSVQHAKAKLLGYIAVNAFPGQPGPPGPPGPVGPPGPNTDSALRTYLKGGPS